MNIDNPRGEHIRELKSLWAEAFGDSESFINSFFDSAFSPERCLAVTEDSGVLSALYWFGCSCLDKPIAYIYAVATQKSHRGLGLGKRLMEYTHERLSSLGYEGAALVPGDGELFGFYEKLGYRISGYKSELRCRASEENVEIHRIGIDEYASLRRKFLPEGGVVQENENLRFLERQAELYSGEDFLLAARRAEDKLYGVELLGNPATASDIVYSLGCTDGVFLTPGEDRPFAMYRSLGDEALSPSYFGLAFD